MEYTLKLSHSDMLRLFHAVTMDTVTRKASSHADAFKAEIERNENLADMIWKKIKAREWLALIEAKKMEQER